MEDYPLNQSVPRKAWQDTAKSFHNIWFFWVVEVIAVAGFVFLFTVITPNDAGRLASAGYQFIGAVVGAIVGFGFIYLLMLSLAPYRQRNEAREALRAIPGATPDTLKIPSTPQLQISYQKHTFGFDGESPIITVYAEYRPTPIGNMRVESIELRLLRQYISCLDWKVIEINQDLWIESDNMFKLPDGISPGEHDVRLAAFANGEWWGSQSFTITVPQVNS